MPTKITVRAGDKGKRDRAIARLVRAYQTGDNPPEELEARDMQFPGRLDILRRLVFYNEPRLIPLFLDVLDRKSASSIDGSDFAETGLRALPDRAAVLKALEERLDHPEKYNTLNLLYPYLRLALPEKEEDVFLPGDLRRWKEEETIRRKYQAKALDLLKYDKQYRYGYLIPGLLGGAEDPFLVDYLLWSRQDQDLVRRGAYALARVKVGREHIPFLESLLQTKNEWAVTDAAILQLVHLDRNKYLAEIRRNPGNFSPQVRKLLEEPEGD